MMMFDVYALGTFSFVGLLAASLLLLRRRRRAQSTGDAGQARAQVRKTREAQADFAVAAEQAMLDLKGSVESLATCLANLELRMRSVDQRQRKLDELSGQLMRRRGFDEAVSLVRDGKPALDIARHCALPLAEVELLRRIHERGARH